MSENTPKKSAWKHKYRHLKRQEDRQEFEGWSENELIDHILELREELDTLQEKLDKTNAPTVEEKSPEMGEKVLNFQSFKPDWPYSTKFVFLLSVENRPLTSKETHEHLLKLDKQYSFYNDPKTTLSVYLRSVVKTGRIKAVKIPGFREKLFAMPEWVDSENNLKPFFQKDLNLF